MIRRLLLALLLLLPIGAAQGSAIGGGSNDRLDGQLTTDIAAHPVTIAAKILVPVHTATTDTAVVLQDTNGATQNSSLALRLGSNDDEYNCATFDTGGTADSAQVSSGAGEYDSVWVSVVCTFTSDADRDAYVGDDTGQETPGNNNQSSISADTLNFVRLL